MDWVNGAWGKVGGSGDAMRIVPSLLYTCFLRQLTFVMASSDTSFRACSDEGHVRYATRVRRSFRAVGAALLLRDEEVA